MERDALRRTLMGLAAAGEGRNRHRERVAEIVKGMNERDESRQYQALLDLNDMLNMGTEESLNALRPELLVKPLIACIHRDHLEVTILAARNLTYLIDCVPPSIPLVVSEGGVAAFCEKLFNIVDVDLADQCLQGLDKLAQEQPISVLRDNALTAILSFIDFFPLASQRRSVNTVTNALRRATAQHVSQIAPVVSLLRDIVVQRDDARMQEQALAALVSVGRLAKTSGGEALAEPLCSEQLVSFLVKVIDSQKTDKIFAASVKLLSVLVSCSVALVEMGRLFGIARVLAQALTIGRGQEGAHASPARLGPGHDVAMMMTPPMGPAAADPSRNTPPIALPEPDAGGVASPKPASGAPAARLSQEVEADVLSALEAMLPPPQTGMMLYVDQGARKLMTASTAALPGGATPASTMSSLMAMTRALSREMERAASGGAAGTDDSTPPRDEDGPPHEGEAEDEDDWADEGDEDEDEEGDGEGDAGEGGEEHAEGEVDHDDDDAPPARLSRQAILRLLRRQGVRTHNDPKHLRCNIGRHSCDLCRKANLVPDDWWRANDRDDFDMCSRCTLEHAAMGEMPTGSVTHMGTLLQAHGIVAPPPPGGGAVPTGATVSARLTAAPPRSSFLPVRLPVVTPLSQLYATSPNLGATYSIIVGPVMNSFLQTESSATAQRCLSVISRVLPLMPEEAMAALAQDTTVPWSAMLRAAITSKDVYQQVHGLFALGSCLAINAPCMIPTLTRGGILSVLRGMKNSTSTATLLDAVVAPAAAATPAATLPVTLNEQLSTMDGWRKHLMTVASNILSDYFSSVSSSQAVRELETARQSLDRITVSASAPPSRTVSSTNLAEADEPDPYQEFTAVVQVLCRAVGTDDSDTGTATVHEIADSGVIEALVRFIRSPLGERDTPPVTSAKRSRRDAHSRGGNPGMPTSAYDAYHRLSMLVAGMSSACPDPSLVLARYIRLLNNVISQFERFDASNAVASSARSAGATSIRLNIVEDVTPTSQPPRATMPSRGRGAAAGGKKTEPPTPTPATTAKTVNVGIDPQATMTAVAEFIVGRIIGLDGGGLAGLFGAMGEETSSEEPSPAPADDAADDEVEEVLPRDMDTPEYEARRRRREARQRQATQNASRGLMGPSPAVVKAAEKLYLRVGRHELPHELSMAEVLHMFVAADKRKEPVTIHWSKDPFSPSVASAAPESSDSGRATLRLAGAVRHRAVLEVASAITRSTELQDVPSVVLASLRILGALATLAQHQHSALRGFSHCVHCHTLSFTPIDVLSASASFARGLEALCGFSKAEFANSKLSQKVQRAVCTVGSSASDTTRSWFVRLALEFPYAFSPKCRQAMFELCFFGTSRSAQRFQDWAQIFGEAVPPQQQRSRIVRHKLRVWRDRVLDCCQAALQAHGASRSVLEFEFYDEQGSGLGPTLEMYSLVGRSIQRTSLGWWRRGDEAPTDELIRAPMGLFPKPHALPFVPAASSPTASGRSSTFAKRLPQASSEGAVATATVSSTSWACFLGRLLGRCILDRRILGVRFSLAFLHALLGEDLTLDDVVDVSPNLYETLDALEDAVARRGDGTVVIGKAKPCTVSDLGLTFTLPGAEVVELMPGGSEVDVSSENAGEYVQLAAKTLLCDGVSDIIADVRKGFEELLSLRACRLLFIDELATLFAGSDVIFTVPELDANTVIDHGFQRSSAPIRNLFECLSAMDATHQRMFLEFLTGTPYLPAGGLAALRPLFTIVRKTSSEAKVSEVDQLPSAMTCQNYLKLPAYPTRDMLEKKLTKAIAEGRGAFLFT